MLVSEARFDTLVSHSLAKTRSICADMKLLRLFKFGFARRLPSNNSTKSKADPSSSTVQQQELHELDSHYDAKGHNVITNNSYTATDLSLKQVVSSESKNKSSAEMSRHHNLKVRSIKNPSSLDRD